MSQSLPRRTDPDARDLHLLRSLSGAGMFLKPTELAADPDLEMDQAEVDERLERLIRDGYVKCYVTATIEGSVAARRAAIPDLSGR